MRILIAEDDNTSRIILQSLLKKWGHEVIAVSDGKQAWEVLQNEDAPHLAILDWMMPGMDGPEVCREARNAFHDDPRYIILLTALGGKENIVAGLEAGADDYLTKPFDAQELLARVQAGQRVVELQAALAHQIKELQEAMSHIKTLQGVLPICMHCRRIRTDPQSWQGLESYIQEHSDAQFSHGLCPECLEEHYPEEALDGE